jgi:nitroreductase
MNPIQPQQLIDCLQWRYAVKRFDASRVIDQTTWSALESSLVLTPSSFGLQPWRFVVITDPNVKAQLPAISWNQKQPQDCSHMVVLAGRKKVDVDYIDRFMNSITQTRQLPEDAMSGYRNFLVSTVSKTEDQHLNWNARQVYIALGQLLTAAAVLGIDACPMEGIDIAAYDKLLELEQSEYSTIVACAMGFRHPEDQQANAKKVRFSADEMVQRV